MPTFLLPCECSTEVAVTSGQAGGSVDCPRCGRRLSVPKLRDLGALERQQPGETAPRTTWRPAHAIVLLGAIVAVGSWVGGLWLTRHSAVAADEALLRSAVLAADDMAIYRVWSEGLSRSSVRRPPADEEQVLLRRARFADSMRSVLNIVAAGAGLAAAAAAIVLRSATRAHP